MPTPPFSPHDLATLASPAEWRLAARELGEEHIGELVLLLRALSPAFRRRFFHALARTRREHGHPRTVVLALARAVHDLREDRR
jgi:hypothetical protein